MSLKAIELQIAIPKTFEAGKLAEQKQQQSHLNQEQAVANTERQMLKNRETVLESAKYAALSDNDKHENDQQSEEKKRQQKEEDEKTVHPYKGSFVDFTG